MKSFFCSLFFLLLFVAGASTSALAEAPNASPSPSHSWGLSFGNKPRPENARTVIDCEDGAWFDDVNNTVEFIGKVVVHDPQFTLTCDRLNVVLDKNRQGLKLVTATGNAVIQQEGTNDQQEKVKSTGKASVVIYEPNTGDITLKVWPQVQQGSNYQIAMEEGTIMVLNNKGTFRTTGQSRTMVHDPGDKTETLPGKN